MRRSFLVAFCLTLFMLLLVLLGAFYFSYLSQQSLQQRLVTARTETITAVESATRSAADLDMALATREVALNALATAEAEAVLLEGQLVAAQQRAEELNNQIATLTQNVDAANEATATRQAAQTAFSIPLVTIINPGADQTLVAGETIEVIVAASDRAGLASLIIEIGGEVYEVPVVGGDNLYVDIRPWTPAAAGDYEIRVQAVNINEESSQTVSRTVTVLGAQIEEETPTATSVP
jgi:hypothetical protein